MKKFFTYAFLFSSILLHAQEEIIEETNSKPIRIGIRGGLSLPSLSDNSNNIYTEDFESYVSFEVGAFANYSFTNTWSLQVELNYTVKGGERSGFQPIPAAQLEGQLPEDVMIPPGTVLNADFENKSALEYIEIPILARYTFGSDWKFFGNIGPYAGFLVGATQKTNGSSGISADIPGVEGVVPVLPDPVSFTAKTDVKDSIKNFNFGAIAGIGIMKDLNTNSQVFFEVRGTYGFIPVQEDETFGKSNIGSVVFALGYSYKL